MDDEKFEHSHHEIKAAAREMPSGCQPPMAARPRIVQIVLDQACGNDGYDLIALDSLGRLWAWDARRDPTGKWVRQWIDIPGPPLGGHTE